MRLILKPRAILVTCGLVFVLVFLSLRSSFHRNSNDSRASGRDFQVEQRPLSDGYKSEELAVKPDRLPSSSSTTTTESFSPVFDKPTRSVPIIKIEQSTVATSSIVTTEDIGQATAGSGNIKETLATELIPSSTKAVEKVYYSSNGTHPSSTQSTAPSQETSPPSALLLIKTGSQTVYRRLPLHLLTLLSGSSAPPHLVYSDAPAFLPPELNIIDALENSTSELKSYDQSAHDFYVKQKISMQAPLYQTTELLPTDPAPPEVDTNGLSPAWRLDRWKFLPMLLHAAQTQPGFDWYIYIEDDTFVFWPSLLHYLTKLNPNEVGYHGAFSGEGNSTFAQGGSGIAFSSALMRKLFSGEKGTMPHLPSLDRYGNLTATTCCGDMALGSILKDYGVQVNGGVYGEYGFRPEPPWHTRFIREIMCKPVFTFHHLHAQDIAELWALQQEVESYGHPSILFADVYDRLIAQRLSPVPVKQWDNRASKFFLGNDLPLTKEFRDIFRDARVRLKSGTNTPDEAFIMNAYESSAGCEEMCRMLHICLSWSWNGAKKICGLDDGVALGRQTESKGPDQDKDGNEKGSNIISGWIMDRVHDALETEKCGK